MINQEYLKSLLSYNESTGDFTWLVNRRGMIGKIAGSEGTRYRQIEIDGVAYSSHKLAWLYMKGYYPDELDHINGKTRRNEFKNLREVTHLENMKNKRKYQNNKTGICGVFWSKLELRYKVSINVGSKPKSLGTFKHIFPAACSRKSAEIKYGYHINHGVTA